MDHPVQYCGCHYDPLPPQEGHRQPEPGGVSVIEVLRQDPDLEVALQDERDGRQEGHEYFEGEMHFVSP